jgi:hypothetical protein
LPRAHARLLIPATDAAAAIVVDLDQRRVVSRFGQPFRVPGPSVVTGDSALITVGRTVDDRLILLALDPRTGRERWTVTVATGTQPAIIDGVALGTTLVAAPPDRPELILWRSMRNGAIGVAVFDYQRRRVIAFHGPFSGQPIALAATAAHPALPQGCLVIGADAGPAQNPRTLLHLVCGRDAPVRDSIVLRDPSVRMQQLVPLPGGAEILVATNAEFLRVDLLTRQVVQRAARISPGPLIRSPLDGRLYVADPGSPAVASGGLIAVLSSGLALSAMIDLHVLAPPDRPLAIQGGATSLDGTWLYLVGGVPLNGPLYGPQPAHVLIVETATGTVRDIVPLGLFGGATPILVP